MWRCLTKLSVEFFLYSVAGVGQYEHNFHIIELVFTITHSDIMYEKTDSEIAPALTKNKHPHLKHLNVGFVIQNHRFHTFPATLQSVYTFEAFLYNILYE